jgi:hypothetical protein
MKKFKLLMPTPERCTDLGIKFEGLYNRTQLWLMGVGFALDRSDSKTEFNITMAKRTEFEIETNNLLFLAAVIDYLTAYGFTCAEENS